MKKHKKILLILLLIVAIPPLYIAEEGVRAIIYFSGISPTTYEYHDVKYYISGEYCNFKGGELAEKTLPPYNQLNNPLFVDFYYQNNLSCETYFVNCGIAFCVGIQYDEVTYKSEKNKIFQNGIFFGRSGEFGNMASDSRLLKKEKVGWGNYLYYLVVCSDQTNSFIHIVCIDDVTHESMSSLDSAVLFSFNLDFWNYFCHE